MKKLLKNNTLVMGSLVLNMLLVVLIIFVNVSKTSDLETVVKIHENDIAKYEETIAKLEVEKEVLTEKIIATQISSMGKYGFDGASKEYTNEVEAHSKKNGFTWIKGGK